MIQSMTGYSRVMRHCAQGLVTAELRSTNHRYLELSYRLPEGLSAFEGAIAQLLRAHVKRGRIDVSVTVKLARGSTRRLVVDDALAQAYYAQLLELKSRLGLKGPVTLEHLLALPQLVSLSDNHAQRQAIWKDVEQALQAAAQQLLARRRAEGRRMSQDILAQLRAITARLKAIRARLPRAAASQRAQLRQRLKGALGGAGAAVSSAQLQEALAVVREVDVHEELVRLASHLTHAKQVLRSAQAVGKTLDFIAQELTREANTLGAKASDEMIARDVIEIKGAIEKIREQAQNLE